MATTLAPPLYTTPEPEPQMPAKHYLNTGRGVASWLLTKDHKRIAMLYLISVTAMALLGGFFATLIRLELLTPQGDLLSAEQYNRTFTMHGVIMIFFMLIPSVPAILGNFLVPIMIGAKDLALPRINLLSWYLYMAGATLMLVSLISGGADTGWTFYTPYSSMYSNAAVVPTAIGAFIAGFSSILTGLNFIVTVHKMRCPGMTWMRLPLFIWAQYATSLVMILGTPVIAMVLVLLFLERVLGFSFFNPASGGDPVLFQHLFWFYSHPAVYIMILPGMGVISELVCAFARKKVFGYSFIAMSSVAIAVVGFLIWGHHMFVSGQSVYEGLLFSVLTFIIAIPSAIKTFNWTATLYRGSISWDAPMVYAIGFFGLFLIGGLTGLFCANLAIDLHIHDTYFIVAHFHYIMVGGGLMGYLGGLHYWWPKMTGRMYPNSLGRVAGVLTFLGFNLTFLPQFILGYMGMPRRYHAYPEEFQVFNIMSTAGAAVLGLGYLLPLCYFIWSLKWGKPAGNNPWGAKGLEWETTSPPPLENFEQTPIQTEEAYAYADEGELQHG